MELKVYTHNVFLVILFTLFLYSQLFSLKITKRNEVTIWHRDKVEKKNLFLLCIFFCHSKLCLCNLFEYFGFSWNNMDSFEIFWIFCNFLEWGAFHHFLVQL